MSKEQSPKPREAKFLNDRRRENQKEFSMEFERVGLKFLRDKIDPRDQKKFISSFDKLVALGCLPETLASSLYCFCKSYRKSGYLFPPYAVPASFPTRKEVKKFRSSLEDAVEVIQRLDGSDLLALWDYRKPPEGRNQVLWVLHWYISLLPTQSSPRRSTDILDLSYPRKDIIESYAPIPCCMYAKVATGEFRFALVSRLLECFGYKPDPKRQTQTKDISRGGYNPHDSSLERNYRNFVQAHPKFCNRLETDLKRNHKDEEERRNAEYDEWVGEKGFAPSDFDELRLNRFDWTSLFSLPQPKPDAPPGRATGLKGDMPKTVDANEPSKKLKTAKEPNPRRSLSKEFDAPR